VGDAVQAGFSGLFCLLALSHFLEQLPVLLPQSLVLSSKLKPSEDFGQKRVELADISPSPANGLADVTGLMALNKAE
jgi:hypothetical protein